VSFTKYILAWILRHHQHKMMNCNTVSQLLAE